MAVATASAPGPAAAAYATGAVADDLALTALISTDQTASDALALVDSTAVDALFAITGDALAGYTSSFNLMYRSAGSCLSDLFAMQCPVHPDWLLCCHSTTPQHMQAHEDTTVLATWMCRTGLRGLPIPCHVSVTSSPIVLGPRYLGMSA